MIIFVTKAGKPTVKKKTTVKKKIIGGIT